jgi:hypothetical protein
MKYCLIDRLNGEIAREGNNRSELSKHAKELSGARSGMQFRLLKKSATS